MAPITYPQDALYCNALIVPQQLYLDHLNELEANRQAAQDYANQYKEMGFEAYNEECFESFCRNLENLKKNGIRFTGHRFVDASENGLTYALYVTTASGETVVLHTEFGMQNGMVTSDYFTQDTPDIVERLHITPIQLYYFYYED